MKTRKIKAYALIRGPNEDNLVRSVPDERPYISGDKSVIELWKQNFDSTCEIVECEIKYKTKK